MIKMKTNKDPEVQLIKNMDGKCPEELKSVNPEDGDGNLKGNFLCYNVYYRYSGYLTNIRNICKVLYFFSIFRSTRGSTDHLG